MSFALNALSNRSLLSIEKASAPRDLTKIQRNIVLIVALSTFFVLAIPALVVYLIFKARTLKDSNPKVQEAAQKTAQAVINKEPFIKSIEPSMPVTAEIKVNEKDKDIEPEQSLVKEDLKEIESPEVKPKQLEPIQIVKQDLVKVISAEDNKVIQELQRGIHKIKTELSILDEKHQGMIKAVLEEINGLDVLDKDLALDEEMRQKVFELRIKLKMTIQKVGVQHELRKKGKIASPLEFELSTLKALDFCISDRSKYHDKERIYEEVSQIAESELQKTELTSLCDISDFFRKIALKVRLKQINLTEPKKIQKFELILFYCQKCRKEDWGKHHIKSILEGVPEDKFPKQIKLLREAIEVKLKKSIDDLLIDSIIYSEIKKNYHNDQRSLKELIDILVNKKATNLSAWCNFRKFPYTENLRKKFEFMKEYGPYLAYEMVQGSEPEETVNDGLCYALNVQLQQNAFSSPEKGPLEIKPQIDAIARFIQARYGLQALRKETRAPLGFEQPEEIAFFFKSSIFEWELCKVFKEIIDRDVDLQKSLGWIMIEYYPVTKHCEKELASYKTAIQFNKARKEGKISLKRMDFLAGHALSVRFDIINKKYELFDPTVGHFNFSNDTNGIKLVIKALYQLIEVFGKSMEGEIKIIRFNQLSLKPTHKME